jgi:D-alanyl-D-alanine-carboxypeptidase/D-alanyl-D-alanine-endopeptidase
MTPYGDRPLILQKAGGLQGMFSYVAFAPTRGIGVFAAINQFNLGGFEKMVAVANELITTLTPR